MDTITIKGVWLLRVGGEGVTGKAVVLVELPDGTLKEAITEALDGNFSHYVRPEGIRNGRTVLFAEETHAQP